LSVKLRKTTISEWVSYFFIKRIDALIDFEEGMCFINFISVGGDIGRVGKRKMGR
jgi:hypothetical protein